MGVVAVAALVPYLALPGKPLVVDAARAITANKVVTEAPLAQAFTRDFWGTPLAAQHSTGSWRPLVTLTYALSARAFGTGGVAFHLGDMALHAGAALLFALLVASLLGEGAGLAAGVLFAVHPAVSEAVCYAVGRADMLAGAALLGALLLHGRARRDARPWRFDGPALGLIACALLSKEYAVAFPVVVAAYDVAVTHRVTARAEQAGGAEQARPLRMLVGSCLIVGAYLVLRIVLTGAVAAVPNVGPADNPVFGQPLGVRTATAFALLALALRLLALPYGLNNYYGWNTVGVAHGFGDPRTLAGLALAAALVAWAAWAWRRRGDGVPALAAALLLAPLAPSLNVTGAAGVLFAERYLYLPAAGCALALVWIARAAMNTVGAGTSSDVGAGLASDVGAGLASEASVTRPDAVTRARVAITATALLALVYAATTMARVADWTSRETLAQHALRWYPDSSGAWYELGLLRAGEGRHAEAAEAFRRAADIPVPNPIVRRNLAIALQSSGRAAEAVLEWRRVIAEAPGEAGPLWRGLGGAQLAAGDLAGGLVSLDKALALDPADEAAKTLRAQAVGTAFAAAREAEQRGERERAIAGYREIQRLDPAYVPAWFTAGRALFDLGRYGEAIDALEHGLKLAPGDPRAIELLSKARAAGER